MPLQQEIQILRIEENQFVFFPFPHGKSIAPSDGRMDARKIKMIFSLYI